MVTKRDGVVLLVYKEKRVIMTWSIMSMHNQYFTCESEIYGGFPNTCSEWVTTAHPQNFSLRV